jgi:hypothetical protein
LALGLTPCLLDAAETVYIRHAGSHGPAATLDGDLDPSLYRVLTITRPGSSSSLTRKQAVAELPLADLTPEARAKAERVVQGLGLFRRLPTLAFDVEPGVYHYLLQHPDVAVSTWRAMEISQFDLKPTGPNVYHADAGDGSVGTIEVWRSTPDETLIYCDGAFKSPLVMKPIIARSIMRLRTHVIDAPGAPPRAECSGEVFVEFPSQTVETIARVISPISYSIADRNFKQLSLYVHLMSQAMTRQPGWVRHLTEQMDATDEQKASLLQLTAQVHQAVLKRAEAQRDPMQFDEIIAPLKLPAERPGIVPVGASR